MLSDDEADRRLLLIEKFKKEGKTIADAADSLSMPRSSLHSWYISYVNRVKRKKLAAQVPPPAPKEVRDSAFFRRQSRELEDKLRKAEHLVEELSGFRSLYVDTFPEWTTGYDNEIGRCILIAHTSDVHYGEKILFGEIYGMNEYNPEIAESRMKRYFNSICLIGERWIGDGVCDGVLLTMCGDLISGEIHEELTRTNSLTSHEQVHGIVKIYGAGILQLAEKYGKVHVVAVPGNHGRTTLKPTAKLAAKLSYDILAASILRDKLIDDKRITWSIAEGTDVRIPIYGRTILVTHGDKMGTGGGQGFAGPVLPIIRGANKVRLQSASAGMDCDLILMGHYHTSAAPPGLLANGSVVGYSEFGNAIRAAVEGPRQWLARFSLSWGLCEMLAIQLEEKPVRMKIKNMERS